MAKLVKKLQNVHDDQINIASSFSIEELEELIEYSSDKYYNTDKPVISDSIYDILIDFLRIKDPKSKTLKNIGAKIKSNNKVKLDYWLGSMDKIKPTTNQLYIWTKKFKPPYNLSDKLDGISALIVYKLESKELKMYTRGTASEGQDISKLIKYLKPPEYDLISDYCKKNKIKGEQNLIAFRGEIIIKEDVFNKKWHGKLKNGRNSVAGLVNSKNINPELAMDTDLIIYEIIDPFYPIDKQLNIINELGFNTVTNKNIGHDLSYEFLSDYLTKRKSKSNYNIDGIIVTSIGDYNRNIDGNPEYAFAYKDINQDQIAKTTIESIEWNISKDGYVKPTLILKPVNIGGVEIKRTTGNNARFIVDNILGPGAIIEIIRSGDVIPKVQKVIKVALSNKPELPEGNWHWNKTNVDIIIDDIENDDVLIKNIYFFFSTLNTKGLGEQNVKKLIDSGLDSVLKIITATKEEFLNVEGFAEKSVDNLIESINYAITDVPLYKIMAASNKIGHGIGEERIKQVLSIYPNLLTDYKKWENEEFIKNLKQINGWELKTSSLFVSNFQEFIKFFNSIKKYIKLEVIKQNIIGEFTDKIIVLTGFRDKELQTKIEEQGGKIGSSISKNTDFLIVKDQNMIDEPTDKINKALILNIKIITKDQLIKLLK
jgi:DNA ligase (NAD+)